MTGDYKDVQRVARQVLNKTASNRMISKQECMVLMGGLDLVKCSERIDCVSVSGSRKMRMTEDEPIATTLIARYKNRPQSLWSMSFHDYYHHINNQNVDRNSRRYKCPHYVGINSQPKFPVTESYAKAVITLYKPWKKDDLIAPRDWISEFREFVDKSGKCPEGVSISYHRVMDRHIKRTTHYEPVASKVDHSANYISEEDRVTLGLANNNVQGEGIDPADHIYKRADTGVSYMWWKPSVTVRCDCLAYSVTGLMNNTL